jgi:aminopeptidase YwaD
MKNILYAFILIVAASCSAKFNPEITVEELKQTIYYLASDSLKGRKAGERGDSLAAVFIRKKFENAGLQLLFENGFQKFELVTSARLGENNMLGFGDEIFQVESDFLPYAFSANKNAEAQVVFAGYGLEIDQDSIQWNDFENVDVTGKWVLVLQGDPDLDNPQSSFDEFSTKRAKALKASDKNAAGLLLVAGNQFSEKDELSPLFFDKNVSRYPIPVIQVTRSVANKILQETGFTIETLESEIKEKSTSISVETNTVVSAHVNIVPEKTESQNVAALLPGIDSELKNEYVIVGAHYDHLGMGGQGSGSRTVDTIAVHYGADDNASGVAAVIELAEKLAGEKKNRRSIIFAAFGAEEMGLIGSKAFTGNPPFETENMVAMFNFDMVGRLDSVSNSLSIGGTQTAKESEELISRLNPGFKLALSGEGIGPSDHASFYLQDIPVFFISTSAHSDYHTPLDGADAINYTGTKQVTEFAHLLVRELATLDSKLTFQEAGAKFQRTRGGRFKVSLGIMPDYAGLEDRGLRIDAVTKGNPADLGGMKKGDIITAINGKKVENIYDYMNRLHTLEAGQTISVDILREEKETVLIIQL